MHTESHRRPPPEWTERCDTLNLLTLKGEYASFIADVENEIAILRHIHDEEPDGFIDERIRERVERLRGIRADAELELADLRERLRENR